MPIKHDGQEGTFRPPVGSLRSFIDYFIYFFLSGLNLFTTTEPSKKKVTDGKIA